MLNLFECVSCCDSCAARKVWCLSAADQELNVHDFDLPLNYLRVCCMYWPHLRNALPEHAEFVGSLSFPGIDFVSDFDDSNLVLQSIADALVAATQYGSLGCLSFDFFGCKRSEETCRLTRVESGPPSSFGSWDHCRHAGARCVRSGQPRGQHGARDALPRRQ